MNNGFQLNYPFLILVLSIGVSLNLFFCASCTKSQSTTANRAERPAVSPAAPNVRSSDDVVKVTPGLIAIAAGGTGEATVAVSVSAGYHINANPATFPYLIATELTPQKIEGVIAGKPLYPAPEKKNFQFAEAPLAVYEGDTQIKLPLHVAPNTTKGMRPLPVTLRVQACDNEKCYPPANLDSHISVEVK